MHADTFVLKNYVLFQRFERMCSNFFTSRFQAKQKIIYKFEIMNFSTHVY